MTDVDDLIKRLKDLAFLSGQRWDTVTVEQEAMKEAADALQRMKEALEPCAKEADRMDLVAGNTGGLRANWEDDRDYQRYAAARRALRGEGT